MFELWGEWGINQKGKVFLHYHLENNAQLRNSSSITGLMCRDNR